MDARTAARYRALWVPGISIMIYNNERNMIFSIKTDQHKRRIIKDGFLNLLIFII